MSTSLPSLMTRRKKNPEYAGLNSANVLADYISNSSCPRSSYQETFSGKKIDKQPEPAAGKDRSNHPNYVSFIYENSRFINQPICFANTKATSHSQAKWWPDQGAVENKKTPKYSTDTVNRTDYKDTIDPSLRATRFGSTKHSEAKSILPHHDSKGLIAKEKISYKHNFDCRQGRIERGRRHGGFVWEPIQDGALKERIRTRLLHN